MENRPFVSGIIAAVTPIPCFVFSILWCWILSFGIGMGLLGYDTIPTWILVCSLLPLLISPVLALIGIVHSLVKIKQKLAWLGLILSVLGLVQNLGLLFMMIYLGQF